MKHIKTFEDLTKYSAMPLSYDASAELDDLEKETEQEEKKRRINIRLF